MYGQCFQNISLSQTFYEKLSVSCSAFICHLQLVYFLYSVSHCWKWSRRLSYLIWPENAPHMWVLAYLAWHASNKIHIYLHLLSFSVHGYFPLGSSHWTAVSHFWKRKQTWIAEASCCGWWGVFWGKWYKGSSSRSKFK